MDVSEKRAFKKYLIFLLPILIAPFYGWFVPWYKDFHRKSQESYVKHVGQAINTAEQSYHQEWKKYSASLKDVGFSADMKDIVIYTTKEEIPEAELKKVPPRDYPLFDRNTYKMILKWTSKDTGIDTLWVLAESGTARKIEN